MSGTVYTLTQVQGANSHGKVAVALVNSGRDRWGDHPTRVFDPENLLWVEWLRVCEYYHFNREGGAL